MKRTNFFIGIFLSFFSPAFYREVVKDWRGKTFLALLTFLALITIVVAILVSSHIFSIGKLMSSEIAQQMPVITVTKGLASTAKKKPKFIYVSGDKAPFIIVDIYNQVSAKKLGQALIQIKQDKVLVKHRQTYKTFKFKEDSNRVFGPKQLKEISHKFLFLFMPLMIALLSLLVISIGYMLILSWSFIAGLFLWIIAKFISREVKYWSAYHVAIIAWIPAITLSTILAIMIVPSSLLLLLFLVIYLVFGLIALPRKES